MGRRIILLLAAAIVAALGTGMVFLYAQKADQRAIAKVEPMKVLVAQQAIAAGTTGAEAEAAGAFVLEEIPATAVAAGAMSDAAAIQDKVASGPIFPGEQILVGKFSDQASYSSLQIPNEKMAVSVQLTDPGRVAGFVTPGSRVAIFAYVKPYVQQVQEGEDGTVTAGEKIDLPEYVRLLLPDVEVLAAGPTTLLSETTTETDGTTTTDEIPKAILTLAVSQEQAEKLVYAVGHGDVLHFALLRDDSKVAPGDAMTLEDLFTFSEGEETGE